MPMTPLYRLMCHPERESRVPVRTVTSTGLVSGVTFGGWNWLQCKQDYWSIIVSRSRTMHPQSLTLTVGGTVLNYGVWLLWYIGSDIWFQDEFWEAYSLNFQSSFSKVWFHEDRCLWDAFGVLQCPFWSSVLQCGARLQILTLKLLDRAVCGASFLTGGWFEWDIGHLRSMAA